MKILTMDTALVPYSHALFEKLVQKGCEFVLVLPEQTDIGKGVKTLDKKNTSYKIYHSRVKKMWYGKNALIDIKKILLTEKPDILFTVWPYFLHLFFDRSILRFMKKNNIRLVIREIPFQVSPFGKLGYYKSHPVYDENLHLLSHGLSFKIRTLLTMYIRRFIYRRTSASMNYYSGAKEIVCSYGLKEKAFYYGNTTDTDAMLAVRNQLNSSERILEEKKRILHIGRLVKWKKVDLLIQAFHELCKKHPDCELVIIGDGPEKETLMKQAETLEFAEKIIFTGAVHDPFRLGQYMKESSAYVLAGMGGLSINDAMCFSLPVICSVCDGTERDLITDGVNGYFFNENDVNSLIEKLDLILSNPAQAKKMGEASFAVIKEKVNLDTISDTYINAFTYAIENPAI